MEVVRTQLCRENRIDETNCVSENAAELTQSNNTESHGKGPLYIVIDTNVFLSNLEIVEEAKDAVFKNYPRPFIVIPWTVICVSIVKILSHLFKNFNIHIFSK